MFINRSDYMEQYLKEIAKELRLMRKEQELQNNLLMQDMGMIPRPGEKSIRLDDGTIVDEKNKPKTKPDIANQLNEMFKR